MSRRFNAAVVACSTLTNHVMAAQEKMNTDYPVYELDNHKHDRPGLFWKMAFQAMEELPQEIDTVFLALGVCGGAAVGRRFPRKTVMPRVDDCITLLLHQDDVFHYNLKKPGHFYLTENEDLMSLEKMRKKMCERHGEKRADRIMGIFFDSYTSVDVIDTGAYDSYSEEYTDRAAREAATIRVPYCHVPGSNRILEKLVSGRWDEQFLVIGKGQTIALEDFEN